MNKNVLTLALTSTLLLSACGGGGGGGSNASTPESIVEQTPETPAPTEPNGICSANNDTIALAHGEECTVSQQLIEEYGLSNISFIEAEQVIMCEDGTLSGAGFSASGLALNSLEVTCAQLDRTPNAFTVLPLVDVGLGQPATSNEVVITGIETDIFVSTLNGEFSVNGGEYTAGPLLVSEGDTLQFQTVSSILPLGEQIVTIDAGNYQTNFSVTTRDNIDPVSVTLEYPYTNSSSDEPMIVVRGSATNGTKITQLLINGTDAETENDYQNWQATITLDEGLNALRIEFADATQILETNEYPFNAEYLAEGQQSQWLKTWQNVKTMKTSGANTYVFDKDAGEIYELDIDEVDTRLVFQDNLLSTYEEATYNDAIRSVVAYNNEGFDLINIDTLSITDLAQPLTNTQTHNFLLDFEIINNGQTLVYGLSNGMVVSVDTATGNQTVLSDAISGIPETGGANIQRPEELLYSSSDETILVLDSTGDQLVKIDIDDLSAETIIDDGLPDGLLDFIDGASFGSDETTLYISSLIGYNILDLDTAAVTSTPIDSSTSGVCDTGEDIIVNESTQIAYQAVRGDGNNPHSSVCITDLMTGQQLRMQPAM